jgi:hypothetical protein
MFADKPKRKENVFQDELLDGEEILWMGKSDKWRIFTSQDWFTIPFSLFWGAIFMTILVMGLNSGKWIVLLIPHVWVGFYLLFGRFILKILRKTHTYYAVTNQRILVMSNLFGRSLQAFSLFHVPTLEKHIGRGGVGTILFEPTPPKSWWSRNQPVPRSSAAMESFNQVPPGFYDIHDVDDVYRLIAQRAHQTIYVPVEKAKPAYLPH